MHVESPGVLDIDGVGLKVYKDEHSIGGEYRLQENYVPLTMAWGRGVYDNNNEWGEYRGGVYMASNVAASCRVWDAQIVDPGNLVGPLGDLSHISHLLGCGELLDEGELVWMTDTTPHESLPLLP